jgi:hypothetical protein
MTLLWVLIVYLDFALIFAGCKHTLDMRFYYPGEEALAKPAFDFFVAKI